MSQEQPSPHRLTAVLFHDFELLDVCGPLEIFGLMPDRFQIELVGPAAGPVRSAQGPELLAQHAYAQAAVPDIALVPGGIGTRQLVRDASFLTWLTTWAAQAPVVASVCTGSGLLAAAGLLDGYRATSNKRAFGWAREQGAQTEWVAQARWVQDRDRWTSSGVAAGMDMALALIAHLYCDDDALVAAQRIEIDWHRDPGWDPFAAVNGLVTE